MMELKSLTLPGRAKLTKVIKVNTTITSTISTSNTIDFFLLILAS